MTTSSRDNQADRSVPAQRAAPAAGGPPPGRRRLTPATVVAFAALCLIWGSTYLFIKIGVDYWPPVLFAAVRNLVATVALALVLTAVALVLRRGWALPGRKGWLPPAVFALFQGTAFALIFWAEQYITSGQTAVLIAANPIITLPLARFWLKEPLRRHHYLAVTLGVLGVALVAGTREGSGFTGSAGIRLVAQLAVLVAAFCYAFSLLYSRRYMRGDKYVNTAIHLGTAGLYLLLLSLVLDPGGGTRVEWNTRSVLALLYLALLGSALAYWLLFYLIERLGPVEVSYNTLVSPVVAVLLGVLVLDEPLTWMVVLGTAAVAAGIYVVVRPPRSSTTPPPRSAADR
ncbi:EamA family transporter [Micromonospora sp. B11E3]|uniref:DMT family transporter n=1 Tax=Micromonospora sp. B11E3 TaxID=3153562 RepID=UPI00325C9906